MAKLADACASLAMRIEVALCKGPSEAKACPEEA